MYPAYFHPVWANGGDWIPTVILVVFVLLPAIGQFISKVLEAQKEAARRAARPAKAAGGKPMDPIEREIAEFLQRVQPPQRREPKPAVPPARGGPPVMAELADQGPGRRPARAVPKVPRRPSPGRPPSSSPIRAAVVAQPAPSEKVSQRVEEFLRTDQIEARTSQFGSRIRQVDEQMEAYLREKFDQELDQMGQLAVDLSEVSTGLPAEGAEAWAPQETAGLALPPTAATGLPSLFATADSVRNAILLYEILQPPWHRW